MTAILLRDVLDDALLGDIVESRAGKTPSRSESSYWGGSIPWLTAKDLKTHRLSSSIERITSRAVQKGSPLAAPGDVLILVRGMTLLKDVPVGVVEAPVSYNQDVRCLRPQDGHSGEYLAYLLLAAKDRLLGAVTQAGHGTGRLDAEQLMSLPLRIPPAHVQMWLVERLRPVERVIHTFDLLIAAMRELKHGLMQELLTGLRRFPEFGPTTSWVNTRAGRLPADWDVVQLREHASELSQRNRAGLGSERVMGVIKGVGLEPMRDHVRGDDLSRYKVVPPQAFAYNPMRINIGSIARSHLTEECLVSPDYVVFETDRCSLLPEFLDHLRHSFLWRRFVAAAGAGSVRVRIYFRDLAELWIPLPPIAEQKRIAGVLDALYREIALLEAQRDQFEQQKRSLMQKLLSGEVEIPTDELED
jgi:type I restriction enzyme S subunit